MPIRHFPLLLPLLLLACKPAGDNNPFAQQLKEPPYTELSNQIEENPQNDSLYFERALLLIQNEQPAAARIDLEKAWSLRPKPEYALALGSQLSDTPAEQLDFLKKATTKLANNFLLDWALADTWQRNGEPDAALRLTESWIQKGADNPEFILLHASLLKEKNRTAEALVTLENLYSKFPTERNIQAMLALWYANAGDEKVIPLCQQMKTADSTGTDPLPHYYLGIYYDTRQEFAQALQAFEKAIQTDYHFVEAYIEKTSILYDQQKWSTALNTLGKALAVAPNNALVYYWTAKCQQATGDQESARLNYLKAYGLDKSLLEAKQAADQLK